MKDDMSIKLHHAVLPASLKGRVTKPSVGIDDSKFPGIYVPAVKTNLAQTYARAFAMLGARKTEKAV
jgi:hypothetical protein